MPKLSTRPPKYCHHKASGHAVAKFNDRLRYLKPYDSTESKTRCQETIAGLFLTVAVWIVSFGDPAEAFI